MPDETRQHLDYVLDGISHGTHPPVDMTGTADALQEADVYAEQVASALEHMPSIRIRFATLLYQVYRIGKRDGIREATNERVR